MEQQLDELDLREIINILRDKWWLIVIFLLSSIIISIYVTNTYITPMYEAKSILFIGKDSNTIAGISLSDLQVDNQLVTDYKELIKTRMISEKVIEELELNITEKEFINRLKVTTIQNSRFIYISYKDANNKIAKEVTNKLSKLLVDKAVQVVGVKNVKIVDYAVLPEKPVSPNMSLNVVVAGILGIIISIFMILLINFIDNTINKEEDIEKYLQLSVLGVVPKFKGEERRDD